MKRARLATLVKPVNGKFTKWKVGQVVKATHIVGSSYAIERLKWIGPKQYKPRLINQCAGVPRSALRFHDQLFPITAAAVNDTLLGPMNLNPQKNDY